MKTKVFGWMAGAAFAFVLTGGATSVCAQGGGDGVGATMAAMGELNKILGKHAAFSADMLMTSKPRGGETVKLKSPLAVRDGQLRLEINLAQLAGNGESMQQMELLGLDRMVLLLQPEKKSGFLLVPALNRACKTDWNALQGRPGEGAATKTVIEKRGLGAEDVGGIRCAKKQVTVTEGKRVTTLTTWEASAPELQGVPVKSEMVMPDGTENRVLLSGIQMKAPPADVFVLPAKCQVYNSLQELMMAALQGAMQQGRTPGR